ncbi:mannose-6-phosphate isomerase, class I [Celerinatantimonas sp. YJH-8]|uniref:mannose-6-phosphate isomerase, class I n=1 Tax=Celerinatantimonas sp. YJH-8 TaxID=3228714 RepID=UPI0038BF933E
MSSLPCFLLMNNPMQHYAWGGYSELEQLFGIANPEHLPQAEIWMGAHPNGCSEVILKQQHIPLNQWIQTDPSAILGAATAQHFGELPYLFKILNAAQALSIQVHPNKAQAEQGFQKEEQQQIPLTAAYRNYKDPNHKPELVYALTQYQAMNGFRPIPEILELFNRVALSPLEIPLQNFQRHPDSDGLRQFFAAVLSLTDTARQQAIQELADYAHTHQQLPLYQLILDLANHYPDDAGLLAPLLLNVVELAPGEAMFLYACTPHAYIKGTGLEIMANSDNVLRAGLTPKHIDIDELLKNTTFVSTPSSAIKMQPTGDCNIADYPIPIEDFRFTVYQGEHRINCHSAEIILAVDGDVLLTHTHGEQLTLHRGQSAFIPAATMQYQLHATHRAARAYC